MMTRPRPVRAPKFPGNGVELCCPECGRPTLFAESSRRDASGWAHEDSRMVTALRCTNCNSGITVTTPDRWLMHIADIADTLARRACASLRDPEQDKRDAAAADIERMAAELKAKAARVRKGELP